MENPINISVKTQYREEQSRPEDDIFVYAYTITLQNTGEQSSQLISRHWQITDENDKVQEVQGIGVVGEQPILEQGESYAYTSGVVIGTETGTMSGSYTMRSEAGEEYEAQIPTFALVPPSALH